MVPWPIALLTLFYGAMAALSAATVWKIATDATDRPLMWPLVWLVVCASLMCGLPLLKSWARTLAIATSMIMIALTLSLAALFVLRGEPLAALAATFGTGVHGVIIRYLQRPVIKEFFNRGEPNGEHLLR